MENERDRVLASIQECVDVDRKAELIGNKILLEHSLALPRRCEEFDINPKSIFTRLPEQHCGAHSSDYRIMDDCETEDRKWWCEAKIEGRQFDRIRLSQGDVVIQT